MSRRPNPAADRAAQNLQTLKSLVKLESNKSCADCKKNKHPRWASWNLGVFVCIRCSGIHRGMGTHISRVKSVDLDTWTDEQLQSVLRWGNARANKYWEHKLAPGHVPSEAKIENFIRTKYESKRWVMEGGIPDPSTLETDADDDVPLSVVQEKAKVERSASQRAASGPQRQVAPPPKQQQNVDLFGDDLEQAPPRPSTTRPPASRSVPPKAEAAAPKVTKPADSLLGLDFFGGATSSPPARPSSNPSAASTSSVPSRPDLKQSILSLYASAPKPAPQPQPQQQQQQQQQQQPQHSHTDSFGGLVSPGASSQQSPQSTGFNDAFSSLSFGPTTSQQPAKSSAFADLTSFSSQRSPPQSAVPPAFGGGGDFFNSQPKAAKPSFPTTQQKPVQSSTQFSGLSNNFSSPTTPAKPAATTSSGMGDLFDFAEPVFPPVPPKPAVPTSPPPMKSAFNLSASSKPQVQAPPKPQPAAPSFSSGFNADPWGSNDAWASAGPTTQAAPSNTTSSNNDFGGWGAAPTAKVASPKVTGDDDFGGWSSAPPAPQSSNNPPKPSGGDDLFSNVWE